MMSPVVSSDRGEVERVEWGCMRGWGGSGEE